MDRRDKHDTFFDMLDQLKYRSTCLRGQTAAMVVRDGRIVSMGYNGAPPGKPHCLDVGCEEQKVPHVMKRREHGTEFIEDDHFYLEGCIRAVHAEANAIAFAARQGISTEGAEMYCLSSPCHKCAQLIVSCGIVRVRYLTPYRAEAGRDWFTECHVELITHE